jgi:hypothetical protein
MTSAMRVRFMPPGVMRCAKVANVVASSIVMPPCAMFTTPAFSMQDRNVSVWPVCTNAMLTGTYATSTRVRAPRPRWW